MEGFDCLLGCVLENLFPRDVDFWKISIMVGKVELREGYFHNLWDRCPLRLVFGWHQRIVLYA